MIYFPFTSGAAFGMIVANLKYPKEQSKRNPEVRQPLNGTLQLDKQLAGFMP